MNQPQAYTHPLPLKPHPLTSHSTHPSRLSQSTGFELTASYSKFPQTIHCTYGKVYISVIQPVHSEGDQPWDFFGRNDAKAETPVLWPPHVKS